jgi:serine/threonine protein kinase
MSRGDTRRSYTKMDIQTPEGPKKIEVVCYRIKHENGKSDRDWCKKQVSFIMNHPHPGIIKPIEIENHRSCGLDPCSYTLVKVPRMRDTIDDILSSRQPDLRKRVLDNISRILVEIAEAVLYIHTEQLRERPERCKGHRGLSSDYIALDEQNHAIIIDYGELLTRTYHRLTISHCAPELISYDIPADDRADSFSLAVLAHELYSGTSLCSDEYSSAIGYAVWNNNPLPPFHPSMPAKIQELCKKCWQKSPADRPSMKEILTVLDPRRAAAITFQRRWRKISDDPYHPVGRRIVMRSYDRMTTNS